MVNSSFPMEKLYEETGNKTNQRQNRRSGTQQERSTTGKSENSRNMEKDISFSMMEENIQESSARGILQERGSTIKTRSSQTKDTGFKGDLYVMKMKFDKNSTILKSIHKKAVHTKDKGRNGRKGNLSFAKQKKQT